MKSVASYRKEDSGVAILIVIIIIQRRGVRVKINRKPGQESGTASDQSESRNTPT